MEAAEDDVRQWLDRVVIGLGLCPFAATPFHNGLVRITVSRARTALTLLADLQAELELVDGTPPGKLETTLIVVAEMLADFDDYNQFLSQVDALLHAGGWNGEFQVASFHPQYQFRGTRTDDPGNLTNRSPWPILHIIREASLDQALSAYPHPEQITKQNIAKMRALSLEERTTYFPWLVMAPDSPAMGRSEST